MSDKITLDPLDVLDLWRWIIRREYKERRHREEDDRGHLPTDMMRSFRGPLGGPAKGKAEMTFAQWLEHSRKQIAAKRGDRT